MKTIFRNVPAPRQPVPGEFIHVVDFGTYLCCACIANGDFRGVRLTDGVSCKFYLPTQPFTIVVPVAVEGGALVFEPAP